MQKQAHAEHGDRDGEHGEVEPDDADGAHRLTTEVNPHARGSGHDQGYATEAAGWSCSPQEPAKSK